MSATLTAEQVPELVAWATARIKARQTAVPVESAFIQQCRTDKAFFIREACQIYDATATSWIPFTLWPAQAEVLRIVDSARWSLVLKCRQVGLSWEMLAYALHVLLFSAPATVLIFSKREEEAKYLLGEQRLQGMYARLPAELRAFAPALPGGTKEWRLVNGSTATAFPCNGGDGRTATLALADEFDLLDVGEQNALMTAVKPTIDAGAQMILISKAHKATPLSPFKRLYAGAPANGWARIFLPWSARPDRTPAWYAAQAAEILSRTGAKDELYENYPATDSEALAPAALDKRLPADWLLPVQTTAPPVAAPGAPALADLVVYTPPQKGAAYVIGADPAEGLVGADESAATVLDKTTGAQVAVWAGQHEPAPFGAGIAALAAWYAGAGVLIERNNHGHAALLALRGATPAPLLLPGTDKKPGWLTTAPSKTALYDGLAATLHAGDGTVADPVTWHQLASIERTTLNAPAGLKDDRAVAYALAQQARAVPRRTGAWSL